LNRQTGIDSLRDLSWREFEQLVGKAYRREGFDVVETGGGGADGGIDLVLHGAKGNILVQCKRWQIQRVGVDKVRELYGMVAAENAAAGILITCGDFTRDAMSFAKAKALTLVDGPQLTKLVRDVQSAPPPVTDAEPSLLPPPCPTCGEPLVLRTAKRGKHAGQDFWGCSQYPNCRGTRDTEVKPS